MGFNSAFKGLNSKKCTNGEQGYEFKVFYLPSEAQEFCFKMNIKIYIKNAPTCFGLITIIRERAI